MNKYEVKLRMLKDGTITWECLVEVESDDTALILAETDELKRQLEKRYPPKVIEIGQDK